MRGTSWVSLLFALLVAGCADDAPAITPGFSPGLYTTPDPTPPILEWRSLGVTSVVVTPRSISTDFEIPERALTILVNQTFDEGAAYGIMIAFGECVWDRPQTFVAVDQTIGADCGGLSAGPKSLQISTRAGALSLTLEPVGLFCHETSPRWGCPAAAPPTRL